MFEGSRKAVKEKLWKWCVEINRVKLEDLEYAIERCDGQILLREDIGKSFCI